MKGIILAGGLGTRLKPLTSVTNKHLLPVYNQPMIYYPIQCLINAGIDDMMVVTGGEHAGDFLKLLGNGKHLGIRHLEYAYQEGQGGIADGLKLAEHFSEGGKVCVVLGDNIIEKNIRKEADEFRAQASGAKLLLKAVDDPRRFGVARLSENADGSRSIVEIIEKPETPPSNLAVTGIYFYDAQSFRVCHELKPSARGELEITDVNNYYLQHSTLTWSELDGWWADAGTHQSLYHAARLVEESGANHLAQSQTASSKSTS